MQSIIARAMFNAEEYDSWYDRHGELYKAELNSLSFILDIPNPKIEIGVGTGRFASMLDIEYGIDPDENMLEFAKKRGIKVVKGYGENIPFPDEFFNLALIATSLPFFREPGRVMEESHRILKKEGIIAVAFIPQNSYFGRKYMDMRRRGDARFRNARFYTPQEVVNLLKPLFKIEQFYSTLIGEKPGLEVKNELNSSASFVVIRARKRNIRFFRNI